MLEFRNLKHIRVQRNQLLHNILTNLELHISYSKLFKVLLTKLVNYF